MNAFELKELILQMLATADKEEIELLEVKEGMSRTDEPIQIVKVKTTYARKYEIEIRKVK